MVMLDLASHWPSRRALKSGCEVFKMRPSNFVIISCAALERFKNPVLLSRPSLDMSLTATLRPTMFQLGGPDRGQTGDLAQSRPFQHEPNYITLQRTLIRYQHLILLTPYPSAKYPPAESS